MLTRTQAIDLRYVHLLEQCRAHIRDARSAAELSELLMVEQQLLWAREQAKWAACDPQDDWIAAGEADARRGTDAFTDDSAASRNPWPLLLLGAGCWALFILAAARWAGEAFR